MKNRNLDRSYSIGEISDRVGLSVSAVRFYADEGLVRPDRSAGGLRKFARSDIRRLSFVMIAQQLGFSLAEIKEALATLPDGRSPTKADWTRLSRGFAKVLDARISAMQDLRDRLDGCIGCGCLSLKACALYNPDDRASRAGSGPRYLLGDRPKA